MLITGDAALTAYRLIQAGHGIDLSDGGALGNISIIVDESELDHASLDNLSADSHTQYVLKSTLTADGQLLGRAVGAPAAVAAPASGQLLGYASGLWAPVTPGQRNMTFMLKGTPGSAPGTIDVNSTTYLGIGPMNFNIDLGTFPFTDFRVLISGNANQAGQTVTALLATFANPSTAISTGDTGLVCTSTPQVFDSGWKTRNDGATGLKEYQLSMKGSNSTVDLAYSYVQLMFRASLPLP